MSYSRSTAIAAACGLAAACTFDPSGLSGGGAASDATADAAVSDLADGAPGGADGAGQPDAEPACDLTSFSQPEVLFELSTIVRDGGPFLSPDRLDIVFYSDRVGGDGERDLWTATRGAVGEDFDTITNLSDVNTGDDESTPSISSDLLDIYFSSDRENGAGNRDVWVASRGDVTSDFAGATNLSEVNSGAEETFPTISADGLTLYFSSDRSDGTGERDIWFATRTSTDMPFSEPEELASVNTPDGEAAVAISSDELEIFIQSDRDGGDGSWDVWRATRASKTDPFDPAEHVPELSTGGVDQPRWLSPDGSELYLSSNDLGSFDIYRATRGCE